MCDKDYCSIYINCSSTKVVKQFAFITFVTGDRHEEDIMFQRLYNYIECIMNRELTQLAMCMIIHTFFSMTSLNLTDAETETVLSAGTACLLTISYRERSDNRANSYNRQLSYTFFLCLQSMPCFPLLLVEMYPTLLYSSYQGHGSSETWLMVVWVDYHLTCSSNLYTCAWQESESREWSMWTAMLKL